MIKKQKYLLILLISLLFINFHIPVHTAIANNLPKGNSERAEIYEWRYKVIGNKLYRRLFNATTQEWVGDWELV